MFANIADTLVRTPTLPCTHAHAKPASVYSDGQSRFYIATASHKADDGKHSS